MTSQFTRGGGNSSSTGKYLAYGFIVLAAAWVLYSKKTGRKAVPDSVVRRLASAAGFVKTKLSRPGKSN